MASRTELKAKFSAGQALVESDFSSLIDSLAHLTDDVANGELATGADITALNASIASLQTLANDTKTELDDFVGDHPTLSQVQAADAAISNSLNASIQALAQTSGNKDTEIESNLASAQAQIDTVQTIQNDSNMAFSVDIQGLMDNKVSQSQLSTLEANLETLANSKSPQGHVHDQYATKVSIANFITASDIPAFAQVSHQHNASEISGLDNLFMNQSQTQALIDANKVELDFETALFDNFYEKDEVDQKFYVARWRVDQISLFTPAVVSICDPRINLAINDVRISIANVRAEEVAKDDSVRALVASTRGEIEVSINNTRSTIESNRVTALSERGVLQNNIDTVQSSATASIASSQANVLTQLSDVRAEVLTETQSNTNAIAQAESDANSYTDTKISDLINGAGAAYNTLKELEDHLVANESSAATALTTQVGLLQADIGTNNTELDNLQTWIHGQAGDNVPSSPFPFSHGVLPRLAGVDSQITSIQSTQVSFQNDLGTFQTTYDSLIASNNSLTTAYNDLLARVTTLENTAYAQAGYVFP